MPLTWIIFKTLDRHRSTKTGLLIVIFTWLCHSAESRTYKIKGSTEQASGEEPIPFSAEFDEFFVEGGAKESGENFGFQGEYNPDYIPYSESRNVTRYVSPTESYHSVKDMPVRGRGHARSNKGEDGYRKGEPTYRKDYRKEDYRPKDGAYSKDGAYQREDSYKKGGDNFSKGGSYKKGDSYNTDGGYRKSDSYRNEESFRKAEPRHRSGNKDYYKERSGHRRHESYRRGGNRPTYRKEESSYHKEEPAYRKDHSGYVKEHREDRNYRKKPIQNLYDDWSPEDDKSFSGEREERTESESYDEDEESDYQDREEEPPHSYKESDSKNPTSLRPGPPYYTPNFKKPSDGNRGHSSNMGSRHKQAPVPTPQTFYTPPMKSNNPSKQFQHRKGEPASTKHPQFENEWAEFRASPPDPLHDSKLEMKEDYTESGYGSPVSQAAKLASTSLPVNRQNCVKLKKMESPPNSNGKYVKNMMTCYVCVDEKTGTNYEECSYESDSKTKPYLKTTGGEQASHSKVSLREKRDVSINERKKRSKDYYESSKGKPYKFDSEPFDDKDDISDVSDKDDDDGSAEYDSDDNCYRKKKGDMSCIVCESPNKQGSYEQCSYQSDPKKNKYEHSVDKIYGSPRLPESNSKYNKKGSSYSGSDEYDSSGEIPSKSEYSSSDYEPTQASLSQGKSKTNRNLFRGSSFGFGLDSFDFGDIGGDRSSKSFDFGDSFDFDSMPEPAENEGQYSNKNEAFDFKSDEIVDIDMPKDLGGFAQKNRSDCKKIIKNKMTCFQCVGNKGAKQEECMYVAAAEPKKKHLSFSQVQEYGFDPDNSTDIGTEYPTFPAGKKKFKKYHPDVTDIKLSNKFQEKATMEASRWPRSPLKSFATSKNSATGLIKEDQEGAASDREYNHDEVDKDEEEEEEDVSEDEESEEKSEITPKEEYNAVPTDPPEIDYKEAEKGEFHKETESAWDPKMGISLPRYMLEKSEHEAIFDEVLASG